MTEEIDVEQSIESVRIGSRWSTASGSYSVALGTGTHVTESHTAVVRTPDGTIEFPTTGRASVSQYVTIPTEDGPRHFVGPDGDGAFREVRG